MHQTTPRSPASLSRTSHVDPRTALPLEDAEQMADRRAGGPGEVAGNLLRILAGIVAACNPWSCCALKQNEWGQSRLAPKGEPCVEGGSVSPWALRW